MRSSFRQVCTWKLLNHSSGELIGNSALWAKFSSRYAQCLSASAHAARWNHSTWVKWALLRWNWHCSRSVLRLLSRMSNIPRWLPSFVIQSFFVRKIQAKKHLVLEVEMPQNAISQSKDFIRERMFCVKFSRGLRPSTPLAETGLRPSPLLPNLLSDKHHFTWSVS